MLNVQTFIALQLLSYLKVPYISAYNVCVLISISRDQILANVLRQWEPFGQTIPSEPWTLKDRNRQTPESDDHAHLQDQ